MMNYQSPRRILASVLKQVVLPHLQFIRHLWVGRSRRQRPQAPELQDHHPLRLYPPLVRGPLRLCHSDIRFIRPCRVDFLTRIRPLRSVVRTHLVEVPWCTKPRMLTWSATTRRRGRLSRGIHYRSLLHLLIIGSFRLQRNTAEKYGYMVQDCYEHENEHGSLYFERGFLHAFRTAFV